MRITRLFIVIIITLAFSGCKDMYFHSPEKARLKATEFLNLLYINENYVTAYSETSSDFRENYRIDYLKDIIDKMRSKYTKIEGIKADFYLVEKDQREIILFYDCISEKGILYNKISMIKNDKGEYVVSGIVASPLPHDKYRTAREFKKY